MNKLNKTVPVITVDGPSGTGKGTICLLLASHLHWHYLDSGAIYRGLALAAELNQVELSDTEALLHLARTLDLEFKVSNQNKVSVVLSGKDVTKSIRSEHCSKKASSISSIPEIRKALLQRQRDYAQWPGLVTDGRDMGTVVFPDAVLKLYLDADQDERARRRYLQLKEAGNNVSLAQVVDELVKRDERDTNRSHSPLKPAEKSVIINTTNINIDQLFDQILKIIKQHIGLTFS